MVAAGSLVLQTRCLLGKLHLMSTFLLVASLPSVPRWTSEHRSSESVSDPTLWLVSFGVFFFVVKFIEGFLFFSFYKPSRLVFGFFGGVFLTCIIVSLIFYSWGGG